MHASGFGYWSALGGDERLPFPLLAEEQRLVWADGDAGRNLAVGAEVALGDALPVAPTGLDDRSVRAGKHAGVARHAEVRVVPDNPIVVFLKRLSEAGCGTGCVFAVPALERDADRAVL